MTTPTCSHHAPPRAPATTCDHGAPAAAAPAADAAVHGNCSAHADPFARLDACHRHVLATLDALESALPELARTQTFDDRLLAALCDTFVVIHTAIPMHSADEEQTLFPRLRQAAPFSSAPVTPMDCMERDHVEHKEMAAALSRAVLQRDAERTLRAARNLIAEYRDHIAKEDEILFPMARAVLTDPVTLARMAAEMQARREAVGLATC